MQRPGAARSGTRDTTGTTGTGTTGTSGSGLRPEDAAFNDATSRMGPAPVGSAAGKARGEKVCGSMCVYVCLEFMCDLCMHAWGRCGQRCQERTRRKGVQEYVRLCVFGVHVRFVHARMELLPVDSAASEAHLRRERMHVLVDVCIGDLLLQIAVSLVRSSSHLFSPSFHTHLPHLRSMCGAGCFWMAWATTVRL